MKSDMILICILSMLLMQCGNSKFKTDKKGYRICEFRSNDVKLNIYNDVLNELVTHHFYGCYLGGEGDSLYNQYIWQKENPDTASYDEGVVKLHNKIFNDTSLFRTMAYRYCLQSGPWSFYMNRYNTYDSLPSFYKELINVNAGQENWKAAADTLATAQTDYSIFDFHSCVLKVIEGDHFYDADAGVISFSKIIINELKTKTILYYEFTCGPKCGKGEILVVELQDNHWQITKVEQIWIS